MQLDPQITAASVNDPIPSKAQAKKIAAEIHNQEYEINKANEEYKAGLKVVESETNALADKLLSGDQAWDILEGLKGASAQAILNTRGFVLPLLDNLQTEVLPHLEDPVGFQKNLQIVVTDSGEITKAILALAETHKDKSGQPTIDDIPLIQECAQGYSQIQQSIENSITPLLLGMIDTMQKAGIKDLPVYEQPTVQEETATQAETSPAVTDTTATVEV